MLWILWWFACFSRRQTDTTIHFLFQSSICDVDLFFQQNGFQSSLVEQLASDPNLLLIVRFSHSTIIVSDSTRYTLLWCCYNVSFLCTRFKNEASIHCYDASFLCTLLCTRDIPVHCYGICRLSWFTVARVHLHGLRGFLGFCESQVCGNQFVCFFGSN